MHRWRPAQSIRVKALGLHWRGGKLLAAEVYDDAGHLKGVRPLGGSVNFSEPAEAAVIREFQEELGVQATITGAPLVIENLYSHEGQQGHEVIFLFPLTFPSNNFGDTIHFTEDSGTPCIARWFDLADLDQPGGPELYPSGLKALLTKPKP
ncbi:NUDIX hydrolase [Pseudoprimorskyibacter insulae]|uniref:Nudix hydrolase domain-containing protein n=1 Tax=Pseudoprimorskyibacter insulae TaxID=1695997 RepID=A0A2R8AV91_9RHOB|nr:NUDIX domain-containing protein [Pseudoprimorskyibacter insulae]SPF79952.1 hypothetical protein PRI8871_01754 [Pseudoprimorskyibacter insulae]